MQFLAKVFVTPLHAPPGFSTHVEAERTALAVDSLRESGRLRLQVRGESMLPTLWPGDVVEIASCSLHEIHPGEIVLAYRDGRFFLHRLVASPAGNSFLLRGDSMPSPDPQFPLEAFVARLTGSAGPATSQNRSQNSAQSEYQEPASPVLPLRPWSKILGRFLCHCGPARRLALRLHQRTKLRQNRNAARVDGSIGPTHRIMDFDAMNFAAIDPEAGAS